MKLFNIFLTCILILLAFSPGLTASASAPVTAAEVAESTPVVTVVRVYYENIEDIELLMSFDLLEYNNLDEKYVLVATNQTGIKKIEKLGFRVEVDAEITAAFNQPVFPGGVQMETIPGYSCYRTVEETYASAASIATNHPSLATWTDAGNSWEKSVGQPDGYDMMILKLANSAVAGDKPILFISGAIHAREYTTAELATRFAEYLVNNYGTDPDVTWLLDYHEIHFMLQTNPDGRKEAESGSSWRKNTNENYCGATSSSRGSDLNRNFSYQWGTGGSSAIPCDATYKGPTAGSEPETQAVQNYMDAIFPDQRANDSTTPAPATAIGLYIDLHSAAGLVLWPWGYTSTTPPNGTQLQTLGRKFGYFNNYKPGQITKLLYVASGGSVDYSYGKLGIASYAFELGTQFFESCTTFTNTILPNNLNALIYAAKVARAPYMTPLGPDALSLAVSSSSVPQGTAVSLTASINDTRFNTSNGTEATQNIAAAEYYIDTPPWVNGAIAIPMTASDGSFNAKTEAVSASVNTSVLSQGRHTLYVRGKDISGNWGAFSAIFLSISGVANQAPMADAQAVSTAEDSALGIILSGSDPENETLTFSVASGPAHGVLSGAAPTLTYTPAADFNGADSFSFVANDGHTSSAPAVVNISVAAVNDAPMATPLVVVTQQETPVAINLTGSDVDGDALTFNVITIPAHGTLSGEAPGLTYTPETSYLGNDSFTFTASDGLSVSGPATVEITVTQVNQQPVADGQTLVTAEDTLLAVVLSGSDPDGDAITFTVASGPLHGVLSGSAPNLTYTPAANYNGSDSFTFIVYDGQVNSLPATIDIAVLAVNDSPVANPQSVTAQQDTAISITLSGSDADGDALTYSVVAFPVNGSLVGTPPSLIYTPAAGYSGTDSFAFKVNDGSVDSADATVIITVNPSGPVTVFTDNFETNLGWMRNPNSTDAATSGVWERANPAATSSSGTKQMGTTTSGSFDLVTGPLAGNNAGSYDIDGGITTIRSPSITMPVGRTITLSLKYYLAHGNNSSTADYLRIKIVGATTTTVLQELGATNDDDAAWATLNVNVSSYAGQTVYILIEAADASGASLVEAAVDDVLIIAQ